VPYLKLSTDPGLYYNIDDFTRSFTEPTACILRAFEASDPSAYRNRAMTERQTI